MATQKSLITTVEAASRLKVTAVRVRQLIADGRISAQQFGRDWMIDPASLAAVKHRKIGRPKKKGK